MSLRYRQDTRVEGVIGGNKHVAARRVLRTCDAKTAPPVDSSLAIGRSPAWLDSAHPSGMQSLPRAPFFPLPPIRQARQHGMPIYALKG